MGFDDRDFRNQAEAMERLDRGERLAQAMAQRVLAIGESRPEAVDSETVQRTGSDLLDIRAALVTAAARFPLAGNEDVHQWFNALVNGVDALAAELAGRCDT
jgi:hypothetical protein